VTVRVESAAECHQVVSAVADYLKTLGRGHCLVSCGCHACFTRRKLTEQLGVLAVLADREAQGRVHPLSQGGRGE
jgi:hypothetical protein